MPLVKTLNAQIIFRHCYVIKNQYMFYKSYINHIKVMTMSGSWDFWGEFTLPSSTAVCCLRYISRKSNSKTQTLVEKMIIFQKQEDHSLFGEIAWTLTSKSKESPFLGLLHYVLRWRVGVTKQNCESKYIF